MENWLELELGQNFKSNSLRMIPEGYVSTKTSVNLEVGVWQQEKDAILPTMRKCISYLLQWIPVSVTTC